VVGGKRPSVPATGAEGAPPAPRTFLGQPSKVKQVVPSAAFEEPPSAAQQLDHQSSSLPPPGKYGSGTLLDAENVDMNVENFMVTQSPPAATSPDVGRKGSLRPKSLLQADASLETVASSANGTLSRATKRVRIAPVPDSGGGADLDDAALLAELQSEMLSLE